MSDTDYRKPKKRAPWVILAALAAILALGAIGRARADEPEVVRLLWVIDEPEITLTST